MWENIVRKLFVLINFSPSRLLFSQRIFHRVLSGRVSAFECSSCLKSLVLAQINYSRTAVAQPPTNQVDWSWRITLSSGNMQTLIHKRPRWILFEHIFGVIFILTIYIVCVHCNDGESTAQPLPQKRGLSHLFAASHVNLELWHKWRMKTFVWFNCRKCQWLGGCN